ncbi:AI-2E family transporter [Paracidovorax wautersii]|uniref:AI-2E family transporter n=1 Tax=Paracidovorax wautersii TaxID=1177982 RepID=UPI0031E2EA78
MPDTLPDSSPPARAGAESATPPDHPAPQPPEPPPPPAAEAAQAVLPHTEVPRVLLHMPVDVRSVSLALIALFLGIGMLHWASAVFIPLMLSVLLTISLQPAVQWLHRWRVPRAVGAGLLLMGIIGGLGGTAWSLSEGASQLVDSLPVAARKVRDAVRLSVPGVSPLDTMQKAASQLEQAASESVPPQTRRGVQRVVVERPPFNIRDYVWSGTMGLASAVGQMTVVVFLTFFSLASGSLFRRKLMRIAGTSLERRKITMEVLDDITGQIQRYLLVQVFTSVLVGAATWAAYAALGLQNAVVWGVVAAALNLAPYVGSLLVTGASALVAFLQFGTLDMALAVGGASLVIHTLIGNLVTPWLTSRTSRMSPVAVFVSVLAWGWLWGLWGLLLGIPVMMVVKAICDRVDDLRPVGELLGD